MREFFTPNFTNLFKTQLSMQLFRGKKSAPREKNPGYAYGICFSVLEIYAKIDTHKFIYSCCNDCTDRRGDQLHRV